MWINSNKFDFGVCLGFLLLFPVGLICFLIGLIIGGPNEDRLMLGGACVMAGAMLGIAAYVQIRIGATPVRESWWGNIMKWAYKDEHPFVYWSTTVTFAICCVILFIEAIVSFVPSGQAGPPIRPHLEAIPGVPERYWFLYEPNFPFSEEEEVVARKNLPFDKISLERIGGLGPPNYVVTFHQNGRATFEGGDNAPRSGPHTSSVDLHDYGRLCYLLERLKLGKLPADIRNRKDHGSGGRATVVRAFQPGKREPIEVWEISGSGPIELWAIQMSIDAVADRMDREVVSQSKEKND